jgi:hypothetical protein
MAPDPARKIMRLRGLRLPLRNSGVTHLFTVPKILQYRGDKPVYSVALSNISVNVYGYHSELIGNLTGYPRDTD